MKRDASKIKTIWVTLSQIFSLVLQLGHGLAKSKAKNSFRKVTSKICFLFLTGNHIIHHNAYMQPFFFLVSFEISSLGVIKPPVPSISKSTSTSLTCDRSTSCCWIACGIMVSPARGPKNQPWQNWKKNWKLQMSSSSNRRVKFLESKRWISLP